MRQQREFDDIWDSLEPCIRQKLESIDSNIRTITSEAGTYGVRKKVIEKRLKERFWGLFQEVAEGDSKMRAGIVRTTNHTPVPRDDKTVSMISDVDTEQWTPEQVKAYITQKYGKLEEPGKKHKVINLRWSRQ